MAFADQIAATFTPISATYDDASVTLALAWAQSFVEEYCNRGPGGFDLNTVTEFIDPTPHRQALIPHIPVQSVSSVQALLPPVVGGQLTWTTLVNYAFVRETGLLYDTTNMVGALPVYEGVPLVRSWPWLPGSLQVNYTYGYETLPMALVHVACRLAQNYLENPASLLSRSIGSGFNERYGGSRSGLEISEFDQRILDRYTLVSIA